MAIKSNHVLICRTDNIGDVILTLPITALLKRHRPSIRISFLCRSYAAPIVRYCRTVDNVIELDTIPDLATYLSTAGIDAVIFAQPDRRLAIAAHRAGIPNRIGNMSRPIHWLHHNRWVYFSKSYSRLHEAQLNFTFLRPFGIRVIPDRVAIPPLYDFSVPEDAAATELLAPHAFNLILHPKSNGNGREWPALHYLALTKSFGDEPDVHFWITGRAAEGNWLGEHAPALLSQPNVTNLCGRQSLDQLASFIHSADGLVASSTGPLHISAAFGKNTLGLFPPKRALSPERWGALGQRAHSLCLTESCSTCKDKRHRNAVTCDCMSNIRPLTVKGIVSRWISEKRGAPK